MAPALTPNKLTGYDVADTKLNDQLRGRICRRFTDRKDGGFAPRMPMSWIWQPWPYRVLLFVSLSIDTIDLHQSLDRFISVENIVVADGNTLQHTT